MVTAPYLNGYADFDDQMCSQYGEIIHNLFILSPYSLHGCVLSYGVRRDNQ